MLTVCSLFDAATQFPFFSKKQASLHCSTVQGGGKQRIA